MTRPMTRRSFLQWSAAGGGQAVGRIALGRLAPAGSALFKGGFVARSAALVPCPQITWVQTPWLGMAALPDNARLPSDDRGNHLRWAFEPALGFPPGGFTLYRRPHVESGPRCAPVTQALNAAPDRRRVEIGGFIVTSNEDLSATEVTNLDGGTRFAVPLDDHAPLVVWPREVCHRLQLAVVDTATTRTPGGPASLRAVAYDRGVRVASATSTSGPGPRAIQRLELVADRIDQVILAPVDPIAGAMHGWLTDLCATDVAASVCASQWERLSVAEICLPLDDDLYPAPCRSDSPTAARAVAAARVSPATWAALEPHFEDLRGTLARLFNTSLPAPPDEPADPPACPPPHDADAEPSLEDDPLGTVLIASLDPGIARAVGLYWVDGVHYVARRLQDVPAAAPGQHHDYLVVGHYPDATALSEVTDSFDDLPAGTTIAADTAHGALRYRPSTSMSVVDRVVGCGRPTARALAWPAAGTATLHIALPERFRAVEVTIAPLAAGATAVARALSGGRVVDVAGESGADGVCAGPDLPHPQILRLTAGTIDAVEVTGAAVAVARVCAFLDDVPGGDIGWLVSDVALGPPPVLAAPAWTESGARGVVARETAGVDGCVPLPAPMAAALRWDRAASPAGLGPLAPVLFDIERQPLGDGPSPDPVAAAAGAWREVRSNVVVALDDDGACEPTDGPLAGDAGRPDYVDAPLDGAPPHQARWQAYRVRGRDAFGRVSAFAGPAVVDLRDTVAPPPPANVRARYLDPDDAGGLDPAERAWTRGGTGGRHGLRIAWRWTDGHRAQAPDAAEFRIYLGGGGGDGVTGRITSVGPASAEHDVSLQTDVRLADLPSVAAAAVGDAFAGEWLAQGPQLYAVVGSGAAAGRLTLTVARRVWAPPPLDDGARIVAPALHPPPAPGPFSVTIRAPRRVAGTVTNHDKPEHAVGPPGGDAGRVTLDTDVAWRGPTEPPAGTTWRLRQGGTTWAIAAVAAGNPCRITIVRRACLPYVPDDGGGFLVVAADGRTPVDIEPGNPFWRDRSRPEAWPSRTWVVPADADTAGRVVAVSDGGPAGSGLRTVRIALEAPGALASDPLDRFLGGTLLSMEAGGAGGSAPVWTIVGPPRRVAGGVEVDVAASVPPGGGPPAYPSPASSVVVLPDRVFELAPPPAIPPGEPAWRGAVAVSTADGDRWATDAAWPAGTPNGGRAGNEGPLSPPADFVRVDRRVPPAVVPDMRVLVASAADAYGFSRFVVRWTPDPSPATRYLVYRAVEPPAGAAAPDDAFTLLTPAPIAAADHPDVDGPGHAAEVSRAAFVDATLPGRTRERFYYRVQAVSPAGVKGAFGPPIGPVRCPDVTPPPTPVVTRVVGRERAIEIAWSPPAGGRIAAFRVHRTDDAAAAGDVRRMALAVTLAGPASSGACAGPGEACWTDEGVGGRAPRHYRIVAVDADGNASAPSAVAVGQAYDDAPPEPPEWRTATWDAAAGGVDLRWLPAAKGVETRVLQRVFGTYVPLTGWLANDHLRFVDSRTPRATTIEYGLQARGPNGLISRTTRALTYRGTRAG